MQEKILNTALLWRPHVTVAIVIEKQGQFLLVEEQFGENLVYNQPAGHWEIHESLPAAIIRETLEETGLQIIPTAIIGIYLYTSSENGITYFRICFTGDCPAQQPQPVNDPDINRHVWLTRSELISRSFKLRSPMVLQCIDDYLAGRRLPLDIIRDLRFL